MEQNQNPLRPEAAADEPASPVNRFDARAPANTPDQPGFNVPLLSDCLNEALSETLADTFPPGGRKPRHDGWTPEKIGGFLRHLAASGMVEHAAESVGLSASGAYALRNRRQGRAFAKMWDAILIHRARARIEGELQSRAIAGCVSVRKRDGVVVGEYHYYDNRLAMSLLTRLDRLAEREAASEAHLRALSEDLDEYCDCLSEGGDADAFVDARRPEDPKEEEPEMAPPGDDHESASLKSDGGDMFTGAEVWEDDEGIWWTEFPPPAGYDGVELGSYGDPDYSRTLSESERAVIDADIAEEQAEDLARQAERRDRCFGFEGGLASADRPEPDENPDSDRGGEADPGEKG